MAIITKRVGEYGAISFLVQVRVRGFKPAARTFKVQTTPQQAKADAKTWADAHEKELREAKNRGDVREDVSTVTIAQLITACLDDPNTSGKKSYDHFERLCLWWQNKYGTMRVRDFGVRTLHKARDDLGGKRGPATVNRCLSTMRSVWNWGSPRSTSSRIGYGPGA